jgi:hypothetical protein
MILRSATVFSLEAGGVRLPKGFPGPAEGRGEIVALLAEGEALAAGWVVPFALTLGRSWGSEGRPVLLADADLGGASLHERLSLPNEEGISDLVLFGASSECALKAIPGENLRFLSAGTVVADPAVVFEHPGWRRRTEAFRRDGAVLLLLVPAGSPSAQGALSHADRVIRLSADPERGEEPGVILVRGAAKPGGAEPPAGGARGGKGKGATPGGDRPAKGGAKGEGSGKAKAAPSGS